MCKGNYGDYNCMRCKRGYSGDDCSQRLAPVVRKNVLSLSEAEQKRLLEILQMTKSVKASGYTVPIREPVTSVSRDSFVEISLFDIFATFHFNSIRDETINKCPNDSFMYNFCNEMSECAVPDFAHEGPAFLTWHRGYLLYVEIEIQKLSTFALPYWDWTDENRRDEIWDLMGRSNCGIFSNPPTFKTVEASVDGPFTNWNTICTNIKDITCNGGNQVCNPTESENLDRIQLVVLKDCSVALR